MTDIEKKQIETIVDHHGYIPIIRVFRGRAAKSGHTDVVTFFDSLILSIEAVHTIEVWDNEDEDEGYNF